MTDTQAAQWRRIGDAWITPIVEKRATLPTGTLFPAHQDNFPAANVPASVALSIHSWIVKTPESLVVIDTGIGNGRDRDGNALFHDLHTDFPRRLAAAGVDRFKVDHVLLTHLHTDHVGWNTHDEDGRWRPMFPNARYVFSKSELEVWQTDPARATILTDSIQPVMDAGLDSTIDPATVPRVASRFVFHPSPGHSIDHASISLETDAGYVLFGGDVMHHPIQIEQPHWSSVFCEDARAAEASRRWALAWCASHQALFCSSHFDAPHMGHILRSAGHPTYRWQPWVPANETA